jgi:hypothetical protein
LAGPPGDGMSIAWDAIAAELLETDELELVLRRGAGSAGRPLIDAIKAALAALEHANASIPDESVLGEGPEPSPYGPVVSLRYLGSEEQRRVWFEAFAAHLTAAGWDGTVQPVTREPASDAMSRLSRQPKLVAFLAYRMTDPAAADRPTAFAVDAGTTAEICRQVVDWGTVPGTSRWLRQGISTVRYEQADLVEQVRWAAEHDYATGVAFVREQPPLARRAELGQWGQVVHQLAADPPDWRGGLDDLRAVLSREAGRLDLAVVRLSRHWATSYLDYDRRPEPPLASITDWRLGRRLWDEYVLDAQGMQVLTDAHLARAADLSGWDVEEVAPGRHLVSARELAPWFAGGEPEAAAVEAARRDFGGMLLTAEAVGRSHS